MAQNSKSNKNTQAKQQQLKKRVQEKVSQQKKKHAAEQKKSCCFWIYGVLFLTVVFVGVLVYDTEVMGKGVFAQSSFGKALDKAGALPYVEKAWYTTMSANARAYKWAEKHVPPYAKSVLKLTSELFKLTCNTLCSTWGKVQEYLSAKLPVAAEFLEQYVPGLPKKIELASVESQKVFMDLVAKSTTFFKTQVFVGRFSPENLSKALNTTTNMAAEYYSMFERKVDFYAKLK